MYFKTSFKIGDREVGEGKPVFVIAEAGSNHDGSMAQAKKLIDAAANLKADAVKFQSYSAQGLVNQAQQPDVYEIIRKISTPVKWLAPLAEHARKRGIIFISTPFDEEQLDELEAVGVDAYKIASGDLTHIPFITAIAKKKKPVILSVGCGDLADVSAAVDAVRAAGNNKLVLLQCIVSYPTDWKDANVAVVNTLRNAFGCPVGYSDHSPDDLIPVLAVANGACMIEKHFTFDRNRPGPDHSFAMEPHEFQTMIHKVRSVSNAMGSPVKHILKCEAEEVYYARRGVYAAVEIKPGQKITREMLLLVRPAKGVKPSEAECLIGRKAVKKIPALSPITWDCV